MPISKKIHRDTFVLSHSMLLPLVILFSGLFRFPSFLSVACTVSLIFFWLTWAACWISTRGIRVSRPHPIESSWITVCHFQLTSFVFAVPAPEGGAHDFCCFCTLFFAISYFPTTNRFPASITNPLLQQTFWGDQIWDLGHSVLKLLTGSYCW